MQRDLRETPLYREAEELCKLLRRPGSGQISDAAEVSTNGVDAVFAGTLVDSLQGTPATRICLTRLSTGDTRVMTFGPNTDRSPKFSPNGQQIAFLSDRHHEGDFQLYLLDPARGAVRSTPAVSGWVEYLHWSPDGRRILLGVAGHGADVAGGQGAVTSQTIAEDLPSWMPSVQSGSESHHWRHAWIYDLESDRAFQVDAPHLNIWEAIWCGSESIAAVASPGPREDEWYSARLQVIDVKSGATREAYKPLTQLGWPAICASGRWLAVVEALCSDRWIVAGDLRIIDTRTGSVLPVDTHGVDIAFTEWRSERTLLLAGHRRFESVVGIYDVVSNTFSETWRSRELTTSGRYISVAGMGEQGDFVLVGEGFLSAPEIAAVYQGRYVPVKSFDLGYNEHVQMIESVAEVIWPAPDGLDIHGWLLRPRGQPPHPLVMYLHGGPVWHWRPTWLGRTGLPIMMLLKRGYAIFFPNPRGSTGRGQEFARHVLGDMGGADTYDCLSGLDHLTRRGIVDPKRLGVTGGSYGGFMTSWLITQDSRFAAAVSLAPVTNQTTEHLLSNIPHFVAAFLADRYTNPGGKYFQRSPVMHAHRVKTPTLNVCGALDRCTPPEEAVQFHSALSENGVTSVLVTYPEEGHGIRKWPAALDFATRVVAWFIEHMPP